MDPELWDVIKRYTIVGVVLAASVVWAVEYTDDNVKGAVNGAPVLEATLSAPDAEVLAAPLPTDSRFFVERHGLRRVACAAACDLEEQCGLRPRAECVNVSCEGDLRKLNKSDFGLEAAAGDCARVAVTPCEEACWRKGECGGGHGSDAACVDACTTLMAKEPARLWREARCILETKSCGDVVKCSGP